jgi:FMN-dependent NADH-azoreductase
MYTFGDPHVEQAAAPDLHVTYRDLAETPIPHLSGAYLTAGRSAGAASDPALQSNLALGNAVLGEFLAADIVVIGVAFYNFTISSQLKAWVDRIAVAGRTFRYTANGVAIGPEQRQTAIAQAQRQIDAIAA